MARNPATPCLGVLILMCVFHKHSAFLRQALAPAEAPVKTQKYKNKLLLSYAETLHEKLDFLR